MQVGSINQTNFNGIKLSSNEIQKVNMKDKVVFMTKNDILQMIHKQKKMKIQQNLLLKTKRQKCLEQEMKAK